MLPVQMVVAQISRFEMLIGRQPISYTSELSRTMNKWHNNTVYGILKLLHRFESDKHNFNLCLHNYSQECARTVLMISCINLGNLSQVYISKASLPIKELVGDFVTYIFYIHGV